MNSALPTLLLLADLLASGGGQWRPPDLVRAEEQLCRGHLAQVSLSPHGGIALKVMLRYQDGTRAVFKPDQTLYSARFGAEIAAHRLAVHLGVRMVPTACERRIPFAALLELTDAPEHSVLRARMEKELRRDADGSVRGATIAWVRRVRELPASLRSTWGPWLRPGAPIPAGEKLRTSDVADLTLLDLLFNNPDRYSGGNLLEDLDTGRLLMIDNGADFRPVPTLHRSFHRSALAMLGRVRAPTYRRIQALRLATVQALLARPVPGGSSFYLTPGELRALFARRNALVEHIERLRRTSGDAAVFLP